MSLEPESVQVEGSNDEKDDMSEDGQAEEEDEIFNRKETSPATSNTSIALKGKNSENEGKSRSTSSIDTMTGAI